MEHFICLNTNSFPAESVEMGYTLFEECIQGLLHLNQPGDRFTIYMDDKQKNLMSFEISENFTYENFLAKLLDNNDIDIFYFLNELEDKSPALDHIPDDIFTQMAEYIFYIPKHAILENPDTLSLAYFLNATLLSINTAPQWDTSKLAIARTADGQYSDETLYLSNISNREHGREILDQFNGISLEAVLGDRIITAQFTEWYDNLQKENQFRVLGKLQLAVEKNFQGGEPLFKSLNDAEGVREIRTSAYPGGAIRILFKPYKKTSHAILIGFIKKNDHEGYKVNIERANTLFNNLK